jgi:polyhydroxybutyrate depolymerase
MTRRKLIAGAALLVIGVPLALLLIVGAWVRVLDRASGSVVTGGQRRDYLLYVPPSYDHAMPTPLVISMHGAAVWPAHQMNTSRWNRLADEHGFIVVYPSGSGMPRIWRAQPGQDPMVDVRFIADLIDTLHAAYNLDPTRIYVNGLSNGGGMASVLSCALSEQIAAVGTVAAAQALPIAWCAEGRPIPMIAFHGTADPIVPYDGGRSPISPVPFPSVRSWVADWAGRNSCEANPTELLVTTDVTRFDYVSCADNAAVVLYTVRGGGHTWPGGKPLPRWIAGRTSQDIDASEQMWTFFRQHRLP